MIRFKQIQAAGWAFKTFAMVIAVAMMFALTPAVSAQDEITDTGISDAVTDEFLFDQAIPSHRIDVSVDEGVVTLSGTVNNIMAKERATRIAETVKGVESVVNTIDVKPATAPSNRALREDIETAFLTNPVTESWEIDVSVDDGDVTLTGSVDSWQEKQLAAKVGKDVSGVTGLTNNIDVDYQMDRLDTEIKTDVSEGLKWDVLVDHGLIDVQVEDGNVTLSGTVGSAAEKTRAMMDAWVAGVDSVDADNLEVAKWARDEDLRKDKYMARDDDEIRDAIVKAFEKHPSVPEEDVNPSVDDGVVTLRGDVQTLEQSRAAANTARNTVGVWRVKNRLNVETVKEVSDEALATNLRERLTNDPYVQRDQVEVSVTDGTVYLTGVVDSYFEKSRAENVSERIPGVEDVVNTLIVSSPLEPYTYDPYVDTSPIYDYGWYDYERDFTYRTDWEIREDIDDELWWSPFVDSDEVEVTVDNGTATLTGTVDTWAERQAAAENAIEGGATSVNNELTVAYGPTYYMP